MIDAHASARHLVEHILPIWSALPEELRGTFTVPHRALVKQLEGLPVTWGQATHAGGLTLIANRHDLTQIHPKRPVIYVEHGAGQTYPHDHPSHPSYSGGAQRDQVVLFLTLNETTAARERAAYPKARVEVVGSPRLDVLASVRAAAGRPSLPACPRPVVAFAWHWNCPLVPETQATFQYWRPALKALAASGEWEILGHGHPRIFNDLVGAYDKLGIEAVRDFSEVVKRADVLAFDNSSAGPEFAAATGRPVLFLNSPKYRRDVIHGGRFYDWPEGQVQCDDLGALPESIDRALADEFAGPARARMVDSIYPPSTRKRSAQLAASAVLEVLDTVSHRV